MSVSQMWVGIWHDAVELFAWGKVTPYCVFRGWQPVYKITGWVFGMQLGVWIGSPSSKYLTSMTNMNIRDRPPCIHELM